MYLCYVDESGTSDVPGNTSHFVLAGLAIPIWYWRNSDQEISAILAKWGLAAAEFHTAWVMRRYLEQSTISNFERMDWTSRRAAIGRYRNAELLRLQKASNPKALKQAKKNFYHTEPYIHLTYDERVAVTREVAEQVGRWGYARLFAECIDKIHFDPVRTHRSVDEQAFEQVVSRFEQYLVNTEAAASSKNFGLVVHDNNTTIAHKHTELMRKFHLDGTLWTRIERIIETPLFVDSKLTRMVQIADLCSYALRRFVENKETELLKLIFPRADRAAGKAVGVRHFAGLTCRCQICDAHHRGIGPLFD